MKMIVAVDNKFGIGYQNKLPWSFKSDMSFFRKITLSHPKTIVLMGRKTYESIPQAFRPLKDRLNVVISTQDLSQNGFKRLTSTTNLNNDVTYFINSLDEIYNFLQTNQEYEAFCIGGASLYNLLLQKGIISSIYLTMIKGDFKCDTFINDIRNKAKVVSSKTQKDVDRKTNKAYFLEFLELEV